MLKLMETLFFKLLCMTPEYLKIKKLGNFLDVNNGVCFLLPLEADFFAPFSKVILKCVFLSAGLLHHFVDHISLSIDYLLFRILRQKAGIPQQMK